MKKTAVSSVDSSIYEGDKAVDMKDKTLFSSKLGSFEHWIRVDLEDSHLIHEVLLFARDTCCTGSADALHGFELRIGMVTGLLKPVFHLATLFARRETKTRMRHRDCLKLAGEKIRREQVGTVRTFLSVRANKFAKWKTGLSITPAVKITLVER